MKLYSTYPYASISMHEDPAFNEVVKNMFLANEVKAIVESGTYLGLGSTTNIARILTEVNSHVDIFYTIEINKKFCRRARKNLQQFPFIEVINGLSVHYPEALEFIANDPALLNHEKYEDVFIDSFDPVNSYLKELKGNLRTQGLFSWIGGKKIEDNIFSRILPTIIHKTPLIILDSAGGIGLLEFNTVLRLMQMNPYYLILDDTHHIKHFRSKKHIYEHPESFKVLYDNSQHGSLICKVN